MLQSPIATSRSSFGAPARTTIFPITFHLKDYTPSWAAASTYLSHVRFRFLLGLQSPRNHFCLLCKPGWRCFRAITLNIIQSRTFGIRGAWLPSISSLRAAKFAKPQLRTIQTFPLDCNRLRQPPCAAISDRHFSVQLRSTCSDYKIFPLLCI